MLKYSCNTLTHIVMLKHFDLYCYIEPTVWSKRHSRRMTFNLNVLTHYYSCNAIRARSDFNFNVYHRYKFLA